MPGVRKLVRDRRKRVRCQSIRRRYDTLEHVQPNVLPEHPWRRSCNGELVPGDVGDEEQVRKDPDVLADPGPIARRHFEDRKDDASKRPEARCVGEDLARRCVVRVVC